jgi:hypothetical protein
MSSKKAAAETSKAVAVPEKKGLVLVDSVDSSMEAEAQKYAGAGTSQAAEDNLVPFVSVLQGNSPQCKPRHEKYVEGAKEGMFYLTDTKEAVEKLIFIPVDLQKFVNEWIPREEGGGFVKAHAAMPADAVQDPEKARLYWTADKKHQLIDTRYHYGLILNEETGDVRPAVITMKGTMHSVSRGWMVQMNQRKISGVIAPSWFTAYELTTVGRTNTQGDWSVIQTKPLGWVPPAIRDAGKSFYEALKSGEKTVDHSAAGGDDEPGAAAGGDSSAI